MDKKAQSMSINVVVVAAIALLVMIILIALFATKIGQFGKQGDSCPNKGGSCMTSCTAGFITIPATGCGTGKSCCLRLGTDCVAAGGVCKKSSDCSGGTLLADCTGDDVCCKS